MTILGIALAALIGISLGLLGAGGSMLTVPILVYVLGYEAKQAIAMSLVVVGATSLAGAIGHWRLRHVRLRLAFTFGVVAMLGAYVAAHYLARFLSGAAQLTLLGLAMLAAAVSMYRRARADEGAESKPGAEPAAAPLAGLAVVGAVGIGVGLLTGLVGIGGGFLFVPALVLLAGLPMREAVGTSLCMIAMNCVAGFLGYVGQVELPWGFLTLFTAVAVAGIGAGTYAVRYVSAATLKRGFAVFLVLMGAFILFRNRAVFL